MVRLFARNLAVLDDLYQFILDPECAGGAAREDEKLMALATEEIFTNLLKYSKDGQRPVQIRRERKDGELTIEITDFAVAAWDITRAQDSELELPLEQRRPGGMGLSLVRQITDQVTYQHVDGNSVITLRKYVRS